MVESAPTVGSMETSDQQVSTCGSYEDPLVLSEDPLVLSEDPLVLSEDPLVLSEDPLVLSEDL